MLKETLTQYLEDSIRKNWNSPALSDYMGEKYTYGHIAQTISQLHAFFDTLGVKPGDKIALMGKNSARWCSVYLSVVSYGAVIVPILPDFKPNDTHTIVNHSDAILLFADPSIFEGLKFEDMAGLLGALSISNYAILGQRSAKLLDAISSSALDRPKEIPQMTPENYKLPHVDNSQLAVISYTSGTTGFAKGVMLKHNSLAANIRFAQRNMPLNPGDKIVSFLPLAHTFGCAFEFLFPFTLGCNITILTKTPSPQIIVQAFQEIRPSLILTVPLVVEKIYKKQVIPAISKSPIKTLIKIPGLRQLILKKIRKKLVAVFGGNFRELVIGGAPLNQEAESFFKAIKFPFTVGYGMTECGPLISYVDWKRNPSGASGRVVDTLEIMIDSSDQQNVPGEILLRGENVMDGYYKNPDATQQAIDSEGWLHSGDMGVIDKHGNVYIKGRIKSLLLGANGKNIYPEELESMLNNRQGVLESLIVQRNEKLVALIHPDQEYVQREKLTNEQLLALFEGYKKEINQQVPSYMNIAQVVLQPDEFAKTPKRSIKRFQYS